MALSHNLYRRAGGTYVVRLRVPARFQAAIGKAEVHRTTGCRDLHLAKIVASELASRWLDALARLQHMDLQRVAAGSLDLLGEGYLPLTHAAGLLGTSPGQLAALLVERHAYLFVKPPEQEGWDGWVIDDVYDLYHERDELGLVSVDLTESQLGVYGRRRRITQPLAFRFGPEAVAIAQTGNPGTICQFLVYPSLLAPTEN